MAQVTDPNLLSQLNAPFDPDAYLAGKKQPNAFDQFDAPARGRNAFDQFDPDAYLAGRKQPDLSTMSDRDLIALHQRTAASPDLSQMSDEQLKQLYHSGEVTDPDLLRQLNGPMSWGDVGSQAVSNLGTSAGHFVSDMVQPFIHPIETAKNLGNLGLGLLEKTQDLYPDTGTPLTRGHEQYPDAVGEFYKQRYGGLENIKRTLASDPVGFAGDLSTIFTGGETLPGRVGELSGVASRLTNPVGLAGQAVKGASSLIGRNTLPARRALADTGVLMTPGQMVGGYFKSLEDAATSVPILGDFINSGRRRSIESFNRAVANQALEPIGETLNRGTAVGHEAVAEVSEKLGDAYDTLLPKINFVPDRQFGADMMRIVQRDVSILPAPQANQFMRILQTRMGPPAPMNGQMFKSVESELTNLANQYRSSPDAAQRGLAGAIDNTVNAMRDNLERANPAYADQLAFINQGWSMFSRMRSAAARRTTSEGVFTPNDLLAAIKSGDKSVGKGAFARGDALMQTFAEAGQRVLPSALPDSGTAKRLATMGAAAAGSWLLHNPLPAAALAAAATPYTRPGMRLTNALASPRTLPRPRMFSTPGNLASQIGRLGATNPYAPQ